MPPISEQVKQPYDQGLYILTGIKQPLPSNFPSPYVITKPISSTSTSPNPPNPAGTVAKHAGSTLVVPVSEGGGRDEPAPAAKGVLQKLRKAFRGLRIGKRKKKNEEEEGEKKDESVRAELAPMKEDGNDGEGKDTSDKVQKPSDQDEAGTRTAAGLASHHDGGQPESASPPGPSNPTTTTPPNALNTLNLTPQSTTSPTSRPPKPISPISPISPLDTSNPTHQFLQRHLPSGLTATTLPANHIRTEVSKYLQEREARRYDDADRHVTNAVDAALREALAEKRKRDGRRRERVGGVGG